MADAAILLIPVLPQILFPYQVEWGWFTAYLQWVAVLPLALYWLWRGHRAAMKWLLICAGISTLASILCGLVMIRHMYGP